MGHFKEENSFCETKLKNLLVDVAKRCRDKKKHPSLPLQFWSFLLERRVGGIEVFVFSLNIAF
jgi:hypothetical protein